ncbi:MAG TPA: CheR family methyltransferase [Methylibium sp.]|uniref:CheR family methyltransferase n=1 Tax=Methylibium sp. TaxID=2067992 RepID=UPI002DBC138B|nr:CheR family methyltransferase [Methylibium sp.]HEU4458538.1 CheR family methyltransferase [Methylibium sp.]
MTAVLSPPAAGDREFDLSGRDFDRVRQLIYQRAGINLQAGKQAMVYSRLSRRLRETGHASFASYLAFLESAGDDTEWQAFVNCLTTNLTSFFREAHHFPLLAEAIARRRGEPMRLWCCAASTGEEPYSLAMTVAETLGAKAQLPIVASDIDTDVLATAERGVYGADAQGLSPERLRAHFLRGTGPNAGSIRVRPELARNVSFRPFNLMSRRWDLGEPFDFVFCRNVMIYFDAPTQRRVLEGIHAAMKPGGLLFVGHSENFSDARTLFALRGKTVYERVGA